MFCFRLLRRGCFQCKRLSAARLVQLIFFASLVNFIFLVVELPADPSSSEPHRTAAAEEGCLTPVLDFPLTIGGSATRGSFNYSMHPGHPKRARNWPHVTSRNGTQVSIDIITGIHNTDWGFIEQTWTILSSQTFQGFIWTTVEDANPWSYSRRLKRFMRGKGQILKCTPLEDLDHCGPARTRNTAIARTNAPYLLFLDPDDMLEPIYLEALVTVLVANPEISLVNTFTVGFGAKNYQWNKTFFLSSKFANMQNICVMLTRETLLRRIGTMDERWTVGEDWELWLELISRGFHGFTVTEFLYWYLEKPWSERFWRPSENQAEVWAAKFPRLYHESWPMLTMEHRMTCVTDFQVFTKASPSSCKQFLMVIPWMAVGGADIANVRILDVMVRDGWRATVVCTLRTSVEETSSQDPDFFRPEFQKYTTDIFVLPHLMQIACYKDFLLHLIRTRGVQVVILSNSYAGYSFLPFLRAESTDVAFIDLIHMREENWVVSTPFHTPRKGGYSALSAMYAKYLDTTMTISDFERYWLLKEIESLGSRSFPETKHVLRIATDIPEPREVSHCEPKELLKVLFVGRLVDQKRPMALLKIFAEAITKINAELDVVGDGFLKPGMAEYIEKYRLGKKVRLLGLQNLTTIYSLYRQADVLLMPSANEGLPIVLLEAMAHSLVPVITNVGAIAEIVNAQNGCLHEVEDDQGMEECLVRLGKNTTLLCDLASRARGRIVELHSMERMRRDLLGIVEGAQEVRRVRGNPSVARRALPSLEMVVSKILQEAGGSHLVNTIETANFRFRRQGFALDLSQVCPETTEAMRQWITTVAELPFCEYSKQKAEPTVIKAMLQKQCGQWCIFDLKDPDHSGFSLDQGECLVWFGDVHECHQWTHLKEHLRTRTEALPA